MYKNNSQNMQKVSKIKTGELCKWDDDQTTDEIRTNLVRAVQQVDEQIKDSLIKANRKQLGLKKFALQQELTALKKVPKLKNIESYFMDAASMALDSDKFNEIKNAAYDMAISEQSDRTKVLRKMRLSDD